MTQTKTNEALGESVSQLTAKFETMTTHQKMMENQIAQIAQQVRHLSRPQGHLSGQPETNPKGQMNTITLRSGRELESPPMPVREERRETDDEGDAAKEAPIEPSSERVHTERTQEIGAEQVSPPVKPYTPPVPYPQRLARSKKEHKYRKFPEML